MSESDDAIKQEILRKVFPELLYDSDPDIERYFDLRKEGRHNEALNLYQGRLLSKYPDENRRISLLQFYRRHDYRYKELLQKSAWELADKIIVRLRLTIERMTDPLFGVHDTDSIRLLKAAERIVSGLPKDKYQAIEAVENLRRYAIILKYRENQMEKVATLIREYLFAAQFEEEKASVDFVARSLEKNARLSALENQNKATKHKFFDVSNIHFSEKDTERIVLPKSITRKEDIVLAYTFKYYLLIQDTSFERLVFLYSRKFSTSHYAIFRAVKFGRLQKRTDDEILNTVNSILSSRYSYSVQGDFYMQIMWRRLKAKLEAKSNDVQEETENLKLEHSTKIQSQSSENKKAQVSNKNVSLQVNNESESKQKASALSEKDTKAEAFTFDKTHTSKVQVQQNTVTQKPKEIVRGESISEKIRKLSGKSYDVYKTLFLSKVRNTIRPYLQKNQTKSHSLFDTAMNDAEEFVYRFIESNYSNPYMNWDTSDAKKNAEALGFSIVNLDTIVEQCFKLL